MTASRFFSPCRSPFRECGCFNGPLLPYRPPPSQNRADTCSRSLLLAPSQAFMPPSVTPPDYCTFRLFLKDVRFAPFLLLPLFSFGRDSGGIGATALVSGCNPTPPREAYATARSFFLLHSSPCKKHSLSDLVARELSRLSF